MYVCIKCFKLEYLFLMDLYDIQKFYPVTCNVFTLQSAFKQWDNCIIKIKTGIIEYNYTK